MRILAYMVDVKAADCPLGSDHTSGACLDGSRRCIYLKEMREDIPNNIIQVECVHPGPEAKEGA